MSILSRNHVALLILAVASGCSSQETAEKTRKVQGSVSIDTMNGIAVPSIVAQSASGATFDGPVAADGTFSVDVPGNDTYRLFLTDLRASGRQSTESVVLWPGLVTWAVVPSGTTSDGPISVGSIVPVGQTDTTQDGVVDSLVNPGGSTGGAGGAADGTRGATSDGTTNGGSSGSSGAGAGGGSGTSGGANGSSDGTSTGTSGGGTSGGTSGGGSSGGGGGGSSDGANGSDGTAGGGSNGGSSGGGSGSGDGSKGGSSSGGSGSGGSSDGPTLCVPPTAKKAACNGSGAGLGAGTATPAPLPPCTPGGGGSASGGSTSATPPSGAPSCEKDKVAVQKKDGRWDCVKMETPVTYFYSDKPIKVRASVEFPHGVMTQWYPDVVGQYPLAADMKDLVSTSSSKAKVCSSKDGNASAANGLLDWGTLDILGRDANVDASLPPAALDRFTWSFARQVQANPLRAGNGQLEKFLFYRGVGNFSLPVRINSMPGGKLALKNLIDDKIGSVFFLNVTADKGTFTEAGGGIARGATLAGAIPTLDNARDVDTYADDLARSVRTQLDGMGLYDDEATAMVNTWKKQWFRTPGPRLLYLAPQSWTDASIPLTIEPKPESTKRVMVIRVEILTPEMEAADVAALKGLTNPATAAATKSHFTALGRFAEPRLRRAMVLAGSPAYATPLLSETIATNHTTHKPTAGTKPLVPQATGPKYKGKGFVVHEWGTDTIVVGSDGSQLLGLQHEEEDLPGFVYDRTK